MAWNPGVFRAQKQVMRKQGSLVEDKVWITFEVGNTFEQLKNEKYVQKHGMDFINKWTLFVRVAGDWSHEKIEQLVEKVHFCDDPPILKEFVENKGFFYECTGYGSFRASVTIFWKRGLHSQN